MFRRCNGMTKYWSVSVSKCTFDPFWRHDSWRTIKREEQAWVQTFEASRGDVARPSKNSPFVSWSRHVVPPYDVEAVISKILHQRSVTSLSSTKELSRIRRRKPRKMSGKQHHHLKGSQSGGNDGKPCRQFLTSKLTSCAENWVFPLKLAFLCSKFLDSIFGEGMTVK